MIIQLEKQIVEYVEYTRLSFSFFFFSFFFRNSMDHIPFVRYYCNHW